MHFVDALRRNNVEEAFRREFAEFDQRLDSAIAIDLARNHIRNYRCTLILGSGVSKTVQLPTWEDLIKSLVKSSITTDDQLMRAVSKFILKDTADPLRQVGHLDYLLQFKSLLKQNIAQSLYQNYDQAKEYLLLEPLCQKLLYPSGAVGMSAVITYNFDDTLEACLRRLGRKFSIIRNESEYSQGSQGLRIFHPHGFLPASHLLDVEQGLVFAEDDYHSQYFSHTSWTNILQMHHFGSRCCIFIGLSFNDPNMRRLLSLHSNKQDDLGRRRHVTIQKTSTNKVVDFFLKKQLQRLGVEIAWVDSYPEMAAILSQLSD
jgi:hypothetical protein